MSAHATVKPMRAMSLIAGGVILEALRRKDAYVLLMLMGLYFVGAMAVGTVGVDSPSTAAFLLNLGLTLAWFAAHVLTLLLAVRQVPDEIENRTLYPLLARPVSRGTYLLGKWAAVTTCGVVTALALFLIGWLPVPKMISPSMGLLLQMLLLQVVSLAMLAALGLLFSLLMPRAVALVLLALLFTVGSNLTSLIGNHAPDSPVVQWILALVPDFQRINLITRWTDEIGPVGLTVFHLLVIHTGLITGTALAVASAVFRRRPL